MALYDDAKELVNQVIAQYKAAMADSVLTWQEGMKLVASSVATFVRLVEKFQGYTGAEKKEVVLTAIGQLFDEVIAPALDGKIPTWINPMVDKLLKQVMLELASAWIDSTVNVFNVMGWDKVLPEGVAAMETVTVFNCLKA